MNTRQQPQTRQSDQTAPKLVVLTEPDTEPPHNTDRLEQYAEVSYVSADELADALPGAEVLFVWDFFSSALSDAWSQADSLRWVHVAAAGVDTLLFDELIDSDVVVTNAHGAFNQPIAEFVLASILAHDKLLHASKSLQQQGIWRHREPHQTAEQRTLIVGPGGIGRAIARLLSAVGMQVRGAGRSERHDDEDFGTIVRSDALVDEVDWCDHLVLVAPLTAATEGLVSDDVLSAMQPSGHLVNVGRGELVDEDALVTALREQKIAAASLDVFTEEPLPGKHPFWDLENVHISAHMSGDVLGWRDTLADQFADNLDRWLSDDALNNEVDKDLGFVPSS